MLLGRRKKKQGSTTLPTSDTDWKAFNKEADALFRDGKLNDARTRYQAMLDAGQVPAWALFCLGRIDMREGRFGEAIKHLDAALELKSDAFWTQYERLIAGFENGEDGKVLAAFFLNMATPPAQVAQPPYSEQLERVAHHIWNAEERDTAARVLEWIAPAKDLSNLGLTRIVERSKNPGLRESAAVRLKAQRKLEPWAARVMSDYFRQAGDEGNELEMLKMQWRAAPDDFNAFLQLGRQYAMQGDETALGELREAGQKFPAKQLSFAEIVFALEMGQDETCFRQLRRHARLYGDVPKFPAIRLAYKLSDALKLDWRDQVLTLLRSQHDDAPEVQLVRINAGIRDQRWDEARAIYDAHFAQMEDKPQNVRLIAIDLMAYTGQLDESVRLLEAEATEADGTYPQNVARAAIRIFGEVGAWDRIVDIGLANLAQETGYGHFFAPMVRAARSAGRVREVYDAFCALEGGLNPGQSAARDALIEELACAGDADIIAQLDDLPLSPARRERVTLMMNAGRHAPAGDGLKTCIYFCVDKNYLVPALVALASLAVNNIGVALGTRFFLLAESDAFEEASLRGGALAARLGLELDVIDAADVVGEADQLKAEYGIFTGGQTLSLAAYYRIFFARYLVEHYDFDRFLYLDSDVVLRDGLAELFSAQMSTPIMARPEIDRPEVNHASRVNALKSPYFNSGVLFFDGRHPQLAESLDRAIAAAIDPDTTLIFQDQCALNIGFDTLHAPLPERFNFFITPDQSSSDFIDERPVVLHFLDRPKPWDSLYRSAGTEWLHWYGLTQSMIGAQIDAAPSKPAAKAKAKTTKAKSTKTTTRKS